MSNIFEVPNYRSGLELDGRVHIVFGAGQGIGRQAAHALAQCGSRVACADIDPDRAAAVAGEIGGIPVTVDVLHAHQLAAAIDSVVEQTGRLDGIVDIIGGSRGAFLEDLDDADAAAEIAFNLTHAVGLAREAAYRMTGGGTMTFVGSIAGLTAIPRQSIYGAAKAGLHHLVRSLAAESGCRGLRINLVAPGFVETPRMVERFSLEDWTELAAATPLGRVGASHEVASAILFLASDLSAYITGHVLVVDGGATLPLRMRGQPSSQQLMGYQRSYRKAP